MAKRKPYIIGAALLLVIVGLYFWSSTADTTAYWRNTQIECIQGHEGIFTHFHPHLAIVAEGEEEVIPGNIGLTAGCMAEIHTHDATGVLHVEAVRAGKTFVLGDFFAVWGMDMERPGYTVSMTVNGEPSEEMGDLVLREGQRIHLNYSPQGNQ